MIRTEKTHLKSIAATHAGMSGKNNEDSYGVSAYLIDEESAAPVLLAILADGIGGHNAGEVASAMVVDIISRKVAESDGTDPLGTLRDAIQSASDQVHQMAQAQDGRKGMGATVVCAWISGKHLYSAYVGDLRLYLVRNRRIYRLTQDHSWIQEALDSGILTPEQAVGHPNAHVIRRYVGSPEAPDVDFRLRLNPAETPQQSIANQGLVLKNGDQLLLCSDGLTDLVNDQEILDLINENPAEEVVDKMIALANKRGGHDNITTVIIRVPDSVFVEGRPVLEPAAQAPEKTLPAAAFPLRPLALGCLGVLAVTVLAAASFFGLRYINGLRSDATPAPSGVFTDQPAGVLESVSPTKPFASGAERTSESIPTARQSSTAEGLPASTLAAPGTSGSSDQGSIPPPPNPGDMTAFPTNTSVPTHTATSTATRTPTVTVSATP